nr:MAG TPA: hypothetical protein [Bacteriophage sp.]
MGVYLRRYWNRGQFCPLISHFPYISIINPFHSTGLKYFD